ncbi:Colossin-A [Rhizoctonia solani]|uniref:Colossin-A n=1 Tax=Rhizoctonia solani TaxID=456999 RepID=A0A0K6FUG3_9AGAM|nr:Colossin-A [Rhizoctonia solani]
MASPHLFACICEGRVFKSPKALSIHQNTCPAVTKRDSKRFLPYPKRSKGGKPPGQRNIPSMAALSGSQFESHTSDSESPEILSYTQLVNATGHENALEETPNHAITPGISYPFTDHTQNINQSSANRPATRSYTRRMNTSYRDECDALPEAPAPILHDASHLPQAPLSYPSTSRARTRLVPFETPVDSFGRYRIYPSKPCSIPDSDCTLADYTNQDFHLEPNDSAPALSLSDTIAPCPNMSTFYFLRWFWKGANKSITSREDLRKNIILNPEFNPQHLNGINLRDVDRQLAAAANTDIIDGTPQSSEGWTQKTVSIKVPLSRRGKGVRSTASKLLSVEGMRSRTILSGIHRGFSWNDTRHFHYTPFQSKWIPTGHPKSNAQIIADEMYTSPAMLEAHKEIQRLEIADHNCRLPRVVAAVMFGSDSLQLGAFSTKKAWVLYMWLGNLSKYERSKPNSGSCYELAHIPSLPDEIKDRIAKLNGRPPLASLLTHLRRELVHSVLHEVLDSEFIHAWRHGIVIKCADGITRRIFPRIFTYAADYPKATIRDKGCCPCPRCLIPMELVHKMGLRSDMQKRIKTQRRDNLQRQKLIRRARAFIYDENTTIGNAEVEYLLQSKSLVPTENAFLKQLLPLKFDFYKIFVVDLLHEVELGVWKSLLKHLIRILYGCGNDTVAEFNRRFHLVPTFSGSTIRKFSEDVASLKRLAARDFEDILQCCIPVFRGLLPSKIDTDVQKLLFSLTRWHALAKLRLHTSATLKHLANETTKLGHQLRDFQAATANFEVYETPREFRARQRQVVARAQRHSTKTPQPPIRKKCHLNLNTFKFHVLGHYVAVIAQNGTTDSFSTQTTELQHRKIKVQWSRTNKDDAVPQMTRIGDIEDALDMIQQRLDKRACSKASDNEQMSHHNNAKPYGIGQTDRTDDAVNIPLWVRSHALNPAMKFFIPSLKQHLLSRIAGNPNSTEIGKVTFQTDRMFSHATLRINYTSYDVRRQYDTINPKSPCRFILLPSNTSDNPHARPFLYARVLGIYHANVRYCGRPPKRMDFVWVRWLDYDDEEPGGWGFDRLDRVSYTTCWNDGELLDGFGFIDPRNIVRAAHLIPDFNSGMGDSTFASNSTLGVSDDNKNDWNYHYINRFVDQDMMMRYLGGGIGHFNHYTNENPMSDIANEITEINSDEDEQIGLEEIEVDDAADMNSDTGHNEIGYVRSEEADPGEDSQEDTSDVSSAEEADEFMSGEEDFIDDLYDL